MKKKILWSIVIGIVIGAISLLRVSGQTPPMAPCVGVGPGCVTGVVPNTPAEGTTGDRGFPLTMIYLQNSGYGNTGYYSGSVYEGYSVTGIVVDLAIYTAVGFVAINFYYMVRKKNTAPSPKKSNI